MTLNETDLQNLLTLIDFHDDYDEVKEVWGFDIGPLREKIVSELTHSTNKMIRYEVRIQTPYNHQEWRSQFFNTLNDAESMVRFYLSCGSKCYMV
jgi:hypothetical protein